MMTEELKALYKAEATYLMAAGWTHTQYGSYRATHWFPPSRVVVGLKVAPDKRWSRRDALTLQRRLDEGDVDDGRDLTAKCDDCRTKIDAIRLVREELGATLREAIDWVESRTKWKK